MHIVAKVPQQKQRKYVNALVKAYVFEIEQHFEKTKRGCPNKTKKTYFTRVNTTFGEKAMSQARVLT